LLYMDEDMDLVTGKVASEPEFPMADLTRSLLSLTDVSGSPTVVIVSFIYPDFIPIKIYPTDDRSFDISIYTLSYPSA